MDCPIIFLLRQTSGTETILDIRFCEEVFYRLGKTKEKLKIYKNGGRRGGLTLQKQFCCYSK